MNRRVTLAGFGCMLLAGYMIWLTGRVIGNLRKVMLAAQAEVLDIADGRSLDDMRQRHQQALEYVQYCDERHDNIVECEKPLIARIKSVTWRTVIWWTEDREMAVFERAAFSKDWKLPAGLVSLGYRSSGRRRRRGLSA